MKLLFLFYFLSTVVLLILVAIILIRSKYFYQKVVAGIGILCVLFLSYSFITEPYSPKVSVTRLQLGLHKKFVVISDLHLGFFKKSDWLQTIVQKINDQKDVDAVLIAGDLTFYPQESEIDALFQPLSLLNYPLYAVLGNHDMGIPGDSALIPLLRDVLKKYRVQVIDNTLVSFYEFTLIGLGDSYANNDDIALINKKDLNLQKTVVLAHNPDSVKKYDQNNRPLLTIAGHTHCGQVRLPWITDWMFSLVASKNYQPGIQNVYNTRLFVTCGVGEVYVPMRFLNPPVIDIIEL